MIYARLGNTGMKVSRICLGCMTYGTPRWRPWVLDDAASRPFIKRALELGINFFDTADMYSDGASEEVLGRALKDLEVKRDEIVIASKVFHPMGKVPNTSGLSRKHIMSAIDNSLRRLQTSYIDLYQIHRWDKDTPIEETMEALHDLVRSGKVRYIGASSMYAWQFAKANAVAKQRGWTQFISMQNHYNLVYREEEREMNPYCLSEGIGLLPWSPLARGFLAGNRKAGEEKKGAATTAIAKDGGPSAAPVAAPAATTTDSSSSSVRAATDTFAHQLYYQADDFVVVERVKEVATRLGVTPAQVSIAWLLHRPGVTAPIIGASKMPQLEEAVAALHIKLTAADMSALEEPYKPHRVLGHS